MADPLSISTGAAGLVSLTIGICQSLVTYYASWKDCDRDIAHLHRYLERVAKNLVHLQSCLGRYDFPATLKQQAELAILACNDEIKSLEIEANRLSSVGSTETRRTRMRTFVRNATYPFKESTLEKLKNSLAQIQSTVDSAVSILGLDTLGALTSASTSIAAEVTDAKQSIIKISNEMPLIRTTIERCEQDLPTISAKISLMNSDIQDIKESLYQVRYESRLDHQYISRELFNALPSTRASSMMIDFAHNNNRQYQIQSNGRKALEFAEKTDTLGRQLDQLQLRCISRPSLMRTELDSVEDDIHLYLADNSKEISFSKNTILPRNRCSCRPILSSAASWSISRNLQISAVSVKNHRKGCPLSKNSENQNHTLRLKTIFAARFLMRALEISLGLTRGAGGCAIASSMGMRTLLRGDSPAFILFDTKPLDLVISKRLEWHKILDYMTDSLTKIRVLFKEGKASPNDINIDGKTIIQLANNWIDNVPYRMRNSQMQSVREELLIGLAHLGVPLNHRDFYDEDVFNTILKNERYFQYYSPQWHVYSTLSALEQAPQPGSWFKSEDLFIVAREREEYADFYDCGILSTAILAKNREAVERILLERPQSIYERNKVGQTPMYLATDWSWGVSRLISAKAPCDIRDRNGFYPLDYAYRIKCWATYELLLAADSPILAPPYCATTSKGFGRFKFSLSNLPPQTFDKMCTALVNRRQRLASLACRVLTVTEYEEFISNRPGVLDSNASVVYDIILNRFLQAPLALEASYNRSTVYHTPWLTTAEMTKLYDAGFHNVDSFDSLEQTPLVIAASEVDLRGSLIALEWLISKGANPLREMTSFGSVQLHYIASAMTPYFLRNLQPLDAGGQWLSRESFFNLQHCVQFLVREHSQVLKDYCHCGCSINGCSPIHLFLKCTMRNIHGGVSCRCQAFGTESKLSPENCERELNAALYYLCEWLLDIIYEGNSIPDLAYHEIIRLFVFKVLGLTHTCCKAFISCRVIIEPQCQEEIEEIRDEEREILEELESLCIEGAARRAYYDGPFHEFLADFLSEIQDRPQVSLNEEQTRKLEEIGVVLEVNCME